ncbi:phosphonate transporter substrate-binding protein [Candidatus Symbiobacter mobilis CR]|uniref:Phosphonate transporter substrate-binding protein n=2 Tax=Candidatus Symbiobacter TaxID=1436289 RepID=U5NAU5_9BURK|nr:phosphonate transporter substrate-binding protein [Candidatus Symbiobacter mobilis CR]
MENRETTVKAMAPMVHYLSAQLGKPVEIVYFDRNSDIVDALVVGKVDLAHVGLLPYVDSHQRNPLVHPLIFFRESDGNTHYRCVLVGVTTGSTPKLADVRGKRIGLTQRMSTCGYLGANAIVRKELGIPLDKFPYKYLGSHEAVLRGVLGGTVDYGVVKEEFANKYANLGVTILAQSLPVPSLGIAGNRRTLGDVLFERIRTVLLATHAAEYERWGLTIRYGMAAAYDTDFDASRSFGDPASIPPEPISH